ncbi:cell division protein FtsQ/DivIB [Gemmobacter denitrificans]|uniref:Cell division protein FtsQ n=1 Tax=Gemmobacter denitrificans TaxID=3123040 RepID=A0ABU8BXK5_9RHOB
MRPLTADRRFADTAPAAPRATVRVGQGPARRDPAPTRMAYRMQRLWLTPLFRIAMRVGVPVLLISGAVALWLGDDARRAAVIAKVEELRTAVEQRPEFMVSVLQITGASPALDTAIRDLLAIRLPQSSFDLDLEAARARISALDAVASVSVQVKSGGVLAVGITERQPALIWRKGDELDLLDATGRRVAQILTRADRPDLPVVTGEGASLAAAEALQIVAAAGPLTPRLRGLVRVGERRWDLVLDRDQRILLPAAAPVRALERLLAFDKAEDLLNRDILTVDLRHPTRPTLRLAPFALKEMRRALGIETVENDL